MPPERQIGPQGGEPRPTGRTNQHNIRTAMTTATFAASRPRRQHNDCVSDQSQRSGSRVYGARGYRLRRRHRRPPPAAAASMVKSSEYSTLSTASNACRNDSLHSPMDASTHSCCISDVSHVELHRLVIVELCLVINRLAGRRVHEFNR